ncbi:methyl-accepting chemotaxis sensory transducer [Brachyspira hampsonii 30446]|uniref:Methyl-accepting chemotaxis sensory transducer n=3 Tax=Brachyspira hampsonii TaxID=1287055 RepID=A0A2U4F0A3_9SPIR|nr:methyl-accepting chemotaxis protein [Brachyspira hampsonii]EKV57562.1 methyl-accepting chemotaxis sensory transducer [Brachyspira hampsonii 30446]OEJ17879.1 chemotaxis protein [Brachyspira hampsonii]
MDYNFSLITLELGIPVIATIISIVGIILYAYIYFQLYEETQAIVLLLGFLSFLFSGLEASNIIISLYSKNNYLALNMYKFEQLALSLTIIPWMMYIRSKLTLSEHFHFVLDKLYIAIVFILILLCAIALLYPQLFISTTQPMSTLSETMKNSIKSRGELGTVYILRDFVFTIYCFVIICSFIYEMTVNKKIKENILLLVLIVLISLAFFDDFNGISIYTKYSSNFLVFKNSTFSRITLVYAIFNIIMIYSSISRFISAVYKKTNQSYDLEGIKAQDSIIINTAINTSEKLSELKANFSESVNNLVSKVENTYSTINNLKNDINRVIEYTNEFITIENFQINDGKINITKINELIETYPNLQASVELQKKTLEESNVKLHESVEKIYALQAQSRNITAMFEDLQKNLEAEKNNFIKEFSKSESFNQLNFQINKIISFMTNMSDKTKTLAINSSIQASKAGEWHNNFSVVSKEVSELVNETSQATNRMQNLLFGIEDIFKKYTYSSNNINNNMSQLSEEISIHYDRINKFNTSMEKQNDYNMNIIKNTDKMHNSISNMTNIIINEENDFLNIKTRIEEINDYIIDISDKASAENLEIKNIMRDMNKLLATSDDLESITNKLNEEMKKFLEYTNDLESKVSEYSKVM